MKKYFFLITIIGILLSCNDSKKPPVDYMLISGTVKNAPDDLILAIGKTHQIIVKDGHYSDTLRIDENQKQKLFVQSNIMKDVRFYYKPGFDLNISFDFNNFKESLMVSGKGEKYVDFINDIRKINFTHGELDEMKLLPEVDFVNKLKKRFDKQKEYIDKDDVLDADFKNKERESVHLDYVRELMSYWKHNKSKDNFIIQKKLKAFDFSDIERYKEAHLYRHFVNNYFEMLSKQYMSENDVSIYKAYANVLIKENITKEMKEKLLSDYFLDFFNLSPYDKNFMSIEELEEIKDIYIEVSENERDKEKVKAAYQKISLLQAGNPAPDFSLANEKGELVSLSDFKGKYVLIDVWATWCGGCVMDLPNFKKLINEYKHKNLVSIKVTLDKNEEVWKKYITKRNLTGINLMGNKKFTSDYNISTISRYILVDPEGKIITVNAPLPDSKEIRQLLDKIT